MTNSNLLELGLRAGLVALLLVSSLTDLRERRVPNEWFFPALGVALVTLTFRERWPENLLAGLALGLAMVLPAFLPRYRGKGAVGGGDVKLVVLLGLVLGMPALAVVCLAALLAGGWALAKRDVHLSTAIPLVPFLTAATLAWWGGEVLLRLWGGP